MPDLYVSPVLSYSVTDGDTVKCVLDLGYAMQHKIAVRIHGINTPEKRGREKIAGLPVRDLLIRWLNGKKLYVRSTKWGKYAKRTIGNVFWVNAEGNEHRVAQFILANGLGVEYGGEKRDPFTDEELQTFIENCKRVAKEKFGVAD